MISFKVSSNSLFLGKIICSRQFMDLITTYIDSSSESWYSDDYDSQLEGYYISKLYYLLCGSSIDKDIFNYISKNILVEESPTRTGKDEEKHIFILRCHTWTIVRKVNHKHS